MEDKERQDKEDEVDELILVIYISYSIRIFEIKHTYTRSWS